MNIFFYFLKLIHVWWKFIKFKLPLSYFYFFPKMSQVQDCQNTNLVQHLQMSSELQQRCPYLQVSAWGRHLQIKEKKYFEYSFNWKQTIHSLNKYMLTHTELKFIYIYAKKEKCFFLLFLKFCSIGKASVEFIECSVYGKFIFNLFLERKY